MLINPHLPICLLSVSSMAASRARPAMLAAAGPHEQGVLWDVDGTLVDSTKLCLDATNMVLVDAAHAPIDEDAYKFGCRYTTPDRFNMHIGMPVGAAEGARLGTSFDDAYVALVSRRTAGLFDGMDRLLRNLAMRGHPQAALSNAAGAYVRAVVAANELDEAPGERLALFSAALGADEVPAAKPAPDGLLLCCERCGVLPAASVYVGDSPSDGVAARAAGMRSVGVLWGANDEAALRSSFDVLVSDVPALTAALRDALAIA